jgi:cell division protein FtsB
MLSKMRWMRSFVVVTLVVCFMVLGMVGSASAVDEKMLERMEQLIKQQQAQIEAQAKALEKLQQQVESLSESAVKEATEAAKAEVAKSTVPANVVSSKNDKVKVQIYGQINQAFLTADDGDSSDYYVVDNDNSSSRMGIIATAKATEDVTVGGKIEYEIQSNASNQVDQDNKSGQGYDGSGDAFNDRHIDAWVEHKTFGKFSIGKGSTASDGTSEIDLSGTDVVGYASVADMAGGILFYDDTTDLLSGTNVGSVFSDFDGLGRDDRIRYDTPKFFGFSLAGSVLSGDGGDVALRYAAQWGDFKFAAAAAYADNGDNNSWDDQYNGSASVLHSSGLNFTVSGGQRNLDTSGRDDPTFYYAKVGYRYQFFDFGESRFSVDYGRNDDLAQDNDEAKTWGIQIVQDFPEWGSEYYIGYRNYDLDRDFSDLEDINALMTGVRVKF